MNTTRIIIQDVEAAMFAGIGEDSAYLAWAWIECCRTGKTFNPYDFYVGEVCQMAIDAHQWWLETEARSGPKKPPPLRSA